jgi:hypothetical protein
LAVTYVDPAAEESKPAEPYELFLDLKARPVTIGLLANAFPDATNFTNCLETALSRSLNGVTIRRYQKASVDPVLPEMLDQIARECDGMIAVWGH